MNYRFIPNRDLADENMVRELESNLGYTLPEDYRQFLLTYNDPYHEPLSTDAHPDTSIGFETPEKFRVIQVFPALSRSAGSYTIHDFYKSAHDHGHPKEFLPILMLNDESKVFLCLEGASKGSVFITGKKWLEKYNAAEAITINDYEKVADSFTDFVSLIKLTPEDTFSGVTS